ncbi:MAG TPA: PilZ domain-containing protein, partial [bacterium]|nr:PilZ domain-containing protein [bacterium]
MAVENDAAVESEKEEPAGKGDRLPDGRYIPYSGGSMGWYEQTGIPKVEMANGYLFHTAVDAHVFRAKRFQRSGTVQDKRAAVRITLRNDASVTLQWGGQTHLARVKDLSAQGLRVQILDDVTINRGDTIQVR